MKKTDNHTTSKILGKVDNYFIIEKLSVDSLGVNFRAIELKDGIPFKHKILTEIHPFLFRNPEEWTRVNVLCERIRNTGNPNLYASEKIIQKDDSTFMVFPYRSGKTLAQIVEDVSVKQKPIPFELAFSIAIAIATMIEIGSSLVVKERNAFHGFLTPDHIIIDYQGHIFLKYYGLWPLFDENETAVSEMARRYGAWLAPEFIRKEKVVPQSDFYYLGYTLYRMLTGNYFSYLPGEDFESTFTSISFVSDLPSTNIQFLTTLINFFKKTLNPTINKRFANVREFKNYILKFFPTPPQDFAEFQSKLVAYMQSLYADTIESDESFLATELSQPLPEILPVYGKGMEGDLMDVPIEGLVREEKKRSRLMQVILILIIVTLTAGTYFLFQQLNKAKEEQHIATKLLEQQNQEKKEFEKKLLEVQQKLETIGSQKTSTIEEQQIKDETISKLKKQEKELEKEVNARTTKNRDIETSGHSKPTFEKKAGVETSGKKAEDIKSVPVEISPDPSRSGEVAPKSTETVKKPEVIPQKEATKPVVPLIPSEKLTVKPAKISGQDPKFPPAMIKTYVGRRATVTARLLIDEAGRVEKVEIEEKHRLPEDIQAVIADTLKKWKYKPAEKDKLKVKVWWPVKLKIHFKYDM